VKQLKAYIDFNVPVKEGESAPRSHLGTLGVAQDIPFDGCRTPYATFWRSVRIFGNMPMLGARTLVASTGAVGPFKFESYREVGTRVQNLAAALQAMGLQPKDRVGLYSQNRPEWIIGEQACYANNLVTVPLYDTLGPEAAELIVQQATVSAVICSQEKVASLVEIAAKFPCLTTIIVMPPQPFEAKPAPPKQPKVPQPPTLRIITLKDAEALGAQTAKQFKHTVPGPQDVATFCYTSGTTGPCTHTHTARA
jgi:long-chain acyl-CoA synthetase